MNRFDVRRHLRGGIALALSTGLLVACAGSQQRPPELVRLENQLARLQSDPVVSAEAPKELQQAANAVRNLSEHGDGMKSRVFDHNVYMADRLLQIAEAEGQSRFARERIDTLSAERERLVAEARAKEADRARHEANMARRDANAALAQADADRRDAAMAREQAEAGTAMITLGTAHPAKFPDAVEKACGMRPALPHWQAHLMAGEERFGTIENDEAALKQLMRDAIATTVS